MHMKERNPQQGYITILVLVFAGVFFVVVSGLSGFIFTQNKLQITKENRERAFQIAEAGLNYYKWFLSHYPTDLQDGTGQPGPYEHTYNDPEGGEIGTFSLEVEANQQCNTTMSIDITSTGWPVEDTSTQRVLFGRYARPSVAEYSFIINSDVWAGSDRTIYGKYHSNGGIRMDGDNQSTVESAQSTWTCTSSFGCSPDSTQNGVFGAGTNPELWSYGVSQISFNSIITDLVNMRSLAQSDGVDLGSSGGFGHHVIFQSDGTIDVYRVTSVGSNDWEYDSVTGWSQVNRTILGETFLQTYTPPSDCGLIFTEDDLWVEGTVNGKLTIVSADLDDVNNETDVMLTGNISYSTLDGSDGLTVVSEGNVLIPLQVPTDMSLRGIFIAQSGRFGRNYYDPSPGYNPTHAQKDSLTINGTIVSNGRVSSKWLCGGSYCSGFNTRNSSYDRTLAKDPPPLTPYTSSDYRFIEWKEEL